MRLLTMVDFISIVAPQTGAMAFNLIKRNKTTPDRSKLKSKKNTKKLCVSVHGDRGYAHCD